MKAESLTELVHEHLERARNASSGRSAHTVHGGHQNQLRQTLIALAAGHRLDEHESPGEATLQVLAGTVTLVTGDERQDSAVGAIVPIPDSRHSLEAVEDSAVLLTVVVRTTADNT
jgi:quercetin dioxygenase-like cupin family protein